MSEKIEITKSEKLKPGDIVEVVFEYQGFSWFQAAQIAIFEERLKRNPQYELLRYNYQGNDIAAQLRVTSEMPDPERGITLNEITLWVVGFPGLAGIVFKRAYKIVGTTVAAAVNVVGTTVTATVNAAKKAVDVTKIFWEWKWVILVGIGVLYFGVLKRK